MSSIAQSFSKSTGYPCLDNSIKAPVLNKVKKKGERGRVCVCGGGEGRETEKKALNEDLRFLGTKYIS